MRHKIALISYLNSKPFHYGLESLYMEEMADIILDTPAGCAQQLMEGNVDLALMPVAAIPTIPNARIVSDWCIGADGEVKTVCIFSHKPLGELDKIYLDAESRTSNLLTEVLLRYFWHLSPELISAGEHYENKIRDKTGGVIIGDRAIMHSGEFPYVYDLAKAWKQFTGLPFVFAAWVSTKELPEELMAKLNDCLAFGISRIPYMTKFLNSPTEDFDLEKYYTKYIQYNLDSKKQEAIQTFLRLIESL